MIKKKSASMVLVVLMFLTSGAVVQASHDSTLVKSEVVTPFYDYITLVGASIDIGNLGRTASSGFVYYSGDYDSTLSIELQRSNGESWAVVKSWSKSFTGSGTHSLEEDYYVTSGHTYRVVNTVTINNGSTVLETATSTSSEVTY